MESPAPPWHPFALTNEVTPGVWEMKHATDYAPFGKIELRRVDGGLLRYRVSLAGVTIGWSTELRVACEQLWKTRLAKLQEGRMGPPNGRVQ